MKHMERLDFNRLREEVIYEKLQSGLNVYLIKKREFNKTLVNMSVKVSDLASRAAEDNKISQIPKGASHFLEHILFHKKYGSIYLKSLGGMMINGYTSNKSTSFVTSFSGNIEKNLELLFDLVWDFYISKEVIRKEKKVIIKELELNKDNINDFVVEKTAELMFNDRLLNIEGLEEDIEEIDNYDLKNLYNEFYMGGNTSLIIMGDFDENEIMKLIHKYDKKTRAGYKKSSCIEMKPVLSNWKKCNWVSSTENICSLGIYLDTETILSPNEYYKLECEFALILEALKYKYPKYKNIRVNTSINKEYNYIIIYKKTYIYEPLSDEFVSDVNNLVIDDDYLEILKNTVISKEIMSMDNLQDYMFNFVKHLEDDQLYLDFNKIILDITAEDLMKFREKLCNQKNHINAFF